MLKNYLLDLKIEFTESFVDDEAGAKEEMMKISDGYLGVPFTWIEKDDGNISKIIGFNRRELDAIFNIHS